MKRLLCLLLLTGLLLTQVCGAWAGEIPSRNPLLRPYDNQAFVETEHEFLNILLLGIDYGHEQYWGSGYKTTFEDCHTDAVLVISIDKTEGKISLVSLPRDTLSYVSGVKGIYKLNAAINCSDSVEQGLKRICGTASWLLGGVEIHKYCAVDMNAVIVLGDAIGGIDFEVDTSFTSNDKVRYYKGMQHLDGRGIMDYLRVRMRAAENANDIGRTGRQRKMMMAIYDKIRKEPALLLKAAGAINNEDIKIFTNIGMEDLLSIASIAFACDPDDLGSYVLTGPYRSALKGWNFTFTDQANRIEVLRTVYGIEAEELPYVSLDYCKWLEASGFAVARRITICNKVRTYAEGLDAIPEKAKAAHEAFEAAFLKAVAAFDQAADTTSRADTTAMNDAVKELREATEAFARAIGYPEKLAWHAGRYWYADEDVNEYLPVWQ